MLTGPQRKFCELYAVDKNGTAAYRVAYPKSSEAAARSSAATLLAKPNIQAEIDEIRRKGAELAGSAALTLAEVHSFVARAVRARVAKLEADSDLWVSIKRGKDGTEYRLPDKLAAIARWCDLQGEGSEAGANDALSAMIGRLRK